MESEELKEKVRLHLNEESEIVDTKLSMSSENAKRLPQGYQKK